jgi:predicted GIY-YIG superfamily endonuclease
MAFYVYIVASGRNGTIYTGSTDDLGKRIWEHRSKAREGFSKTFWLRPARLVRGLRLTRRSLPPRAADQGMATQLEAHADRGAQPDLA